MKKKILSLLMIMGTVLASHAQVKIGTPGNPDPGAVLDLDGGTNRGLLLPRLSNADMVAMSTATNGMMIYNTTQHALYLRKAGNWVKLTDGWSAFSLPHLGTYNQSPGAVLDLYNIGGINGIAIQGKSNEGRGIVGISAQGTGVQGIATSGIGGHFEASTGFPAIQTGTGSVCIGTATSTKAKLIVNGAWGNVAALFGEGIPGVAIEISDPAVTFNTYYNGTRKSMTNGYYGGYMTLSPITGKFTIHSSPATGTADVTLPMNIRMTLTKEGNMGVQGNNDPHSPLSFADQLGNKISLWGNSPVAHYGLGIQASLLQMYSGSAADDIAFGYGSSAAFTEHMRIKGNGMIGIGTTTPAYPLTLASASAGFVQKGGTVEVGTGVSASAGIIKTYSNHALHFSTNNNATAQMMLNTGGDVGIGTTFPQARMHIRDDQQNGLIVDNSTPLDNDINAKILFKTGSFYTASVGTIGTGSISARLAFSTDASSTASLLEERMSILNNGNVGINTVTPTTKLEVAGKTKITQGAGDNAALELNGAIMVSGPSKAAFVRTASAAEAGTKSIVIDHPMCNNDPNAILMVTARNSTPVWVNYDAAIGKWRLETGGEFISGYSILSMKTCGDLCIHPKNLGSAANAFGQGEKFNILVIKSI